MPTQVAAALPKELAPVVKEHQFPSTEDGEPELRLLNKLLISDTCWYCTFTLFVTVSLRSQDSQSVNHPLEETAEIQIQ